MGNRTEWLAAVALVAACTVASKRAAAQQIVLQGIADAEMWATDSASLNLPRNDGHPGPAGRLTLLPGVVLGSRVQIFGVLEGRAGAADEGGRNAVYLDEALGRVIAFPWLVFDVGKLPTPVGTYVNHRLSPVNPLIGAPVAYPVSYPVGMEVWGSTSRLDYRVALVDRPYSNERDVGVPGVAWRPALGAGVTLVTGFRLGASVTWGPYLGDRDTLALPTGARWQDYHQRVVGFDGRFSRGYLELRGEIAFSRYDVPAAAAATGTAYYAEAKYTWTPRFFTAARFERNRYPFIRPSTGGAWTTREAVSFNGEVGVGYRPAPGAIVKVSVRKDHWPADAYQRVIYPDGYALAFQVSYVFDVVGWARRLF